MPRGRGRDRDDLAVRRFELARLPGRKPLGIATKPVRSRLRGQHPAGLRQKSAAGEVEIVRMLVVAQEHRIDLAQLLREHRGLRGLLQSHMRELIIARIVEGRIGQEAQAAKLDERGWPADQALSLRWSFWFPPGAAPIRGRTGGYASAGDNARRAATVPKEIKIARNQLGAKARRYEQACCAFCTAAARPSSEY